MTEMWRRRESARRRAACWFAAPAALLLSAIATNAGQTSNAVRFLRYDEVRDVVREYRSMGELLAFGDDEESWHAWLVGRDAETRSRIDEGVADSISNLILYGTSFTNAPRLVNFEEATGQSGELVPRVRERVREFAKALRQTNAGERVTLAKAFLARQHVADGDVEACLTKNLERFVRDQREYQKKMEASSSEANAGEALGVRGTLYADRGLSVDTSLLPNYALEKTLAAMLRKGAIEAGSMKRVAIIGPGLDYADKRGGYDFYPLQTIQPFAVLDSLARLGLSDKSRVELTAFDLNHTVLDHVKRLAAVGKAGRGYTIQLPRDLTADWNEEAVGYWRGFGSGVGAEVPAIAMPRTLAETTTRAVKIHAAVAARMKTADLNIVAQTMDLEKGMGFDLIVATNVLVYYDHFEQAVAMTGIARLLNHGGIFLCNNALPAQHPEELKYLGRLTVTFSEHGAFGDDVVVYRKQ